VIVEDLMLVLTRPWVAVAIVLAAMLFRWEPQR
jgi:hypothetical protein